MEYIFVVGRYRKNGEREGNGWLWSGRRWDEEGDGREMIMDVEIKVFRSDRLLPLRRLLVAPEFI